MTDNAIVAGLCVLFFAYTFVGRQDIQHMTREFVAQKTQEYALSSVDAVDKILHSEFSRRLLAASEIEAMEAEIAEFRTQPARYVERIASSNLPITPKAGVSPTSAKIDVWKERIRMYYNTVVDRLFTDLRIFSSTNIVAACIAFGCAWRSPSQPAWRLKLISGLLVIAVVYGSWMYVDSLSFFTILFNRYLGWGYPFMLGCLFYDMLMRVDEVTKAVKEDVHAKPISRRKVAAKV